MKKYELKLKHEALAVVVGSYACGRCVDVVQNEYDYKSIQWGGFIDYETALSESKTDYVYAACFHGDNAFRQTDEYEWQYVNHASPLFLICFVDVDRVYAIFKDGEPWIVNIHQYDDAKLPIHSIEPHRPRPRDNVHNLFG
jgi:hypothetical protein